MTKVDIRSNISKKVIKPLIFISLLVLGEMSFLFGNGVDYVLALINEPPSRETYDSPNPFDFYVDYMGEIGGSQPGPKQTRTYNLNQGISNPDTNPDSYDYFIVKMQKDGFNFVNFGPYTQPEIYWKDVSDKIKVLGNSPSNYRIQVSPNTTWSWRVWRVRTNNEGFPEIDKPNFIKHKDQVYPYVNDGSLIAGCTISYLMMDDDPAEIGDRRQQSWKIQKKTGNKWKTEQTEIVPDGMVVGKSFSVNDSPGGPFAGVPAKDLRLVLEAEDSINILHLEQCGTTYTWQVRMKGVFIANAQREREGTGESGFKFERNLIVPAGVAPLLIEYDPKYLIEFAGLLGEALIDWVEIPN